MGRDICGWREKIGVGEKRVDGERKVGLERVKRGWKR